MVFTLALQTVIYYFGGDSIDFAKRTRKMKRLLPLIILVMLMAFNSSAQTKRALIVAIGDYPAETKWRPINSLNDVPLIQTALEKQGFSEFTVLKNEQATKNGIEQAFKDLAEATQPNDIVVIHFSSHGQRIADDDQDELDGYDEAIVSYGAQAFYSATYHGEEHLRDDEIEDLVMAIRIRAGKNGDVLMIADACHSGTISRGEISRGGQPPLEDPNNPPLARGQEDVGLYQPPKPSRGNDNNISPFVLISASQASEVNYEYQGAGSLSTAINRTVSKLGEKASYRSFFAQILKEMSEIAPNQVPAIEGDIDRELFAGKSVSQENYYLPSKLFGASMNVWGGTLNGLFKDTEVAIFPAGTTNSKEGTPITTGKVINAEGTWSKIALDKALTEDPSAYWVFVTKQTYGDISVGVRLSLKSAEKQAALMAALNGFGLVKTDVEKPEFILTGGDYNLVTIVRASDQSVFEDEVDISGDADDLKEILKNYAKGNFIKNMDMRYPGIDVEFEFIPIRIDDNENILDTLTIEEISKNGVMAVNEHIGVHIKVTNKGTRKAFFAIVDIQPDGKINGIIPDPDPMSGHQAEQFELAPGKSYIIPDHKVIFGAPYGGEVFKLFASKRPIDFRPILSGDGKTRSAMTEMEVLFSDSLDAATRGGKSSAVSTSMEASTYAISFRIEEEH